MVGIVVMAAATMVDILKAGIMETIIERKTHRSPKFLKTYLLLLTVVALFTTGGCSMFSSNRNATNDRNHLGNGADTGNSSGMGLGGNPGN